MQRFNALLADGLVHRVVRLRHTGLDVLLDEGRAFKNPVLLRPYGAGYTASLRFWSYTANALAWGGPLGLVWLPWWALPCFWIAARAIYLANRKAAGDFLAEALQRHPDRVSVMSLAGLVHPAASLAGPLVKG